MKSFFCFRPKMANSPRRSFGSLRRVTTYESLATGQRSEVLRRKLSTPRIKRKFLTPVLTRKCGNRDLNCSEIVTEEFLKVRNVEAQTSTLERALVASQRRKIQNLDYQKKFIFPPIEQ